MSGPMIQMDRAFGMNQGIFCLKNDTCTKTSIRGSKLNKLNDVARAKLTFQMLTLQTKKAFYQVMQTRSVTQHPRERRL